MTETATTKTNSRGGARKASAAYLEIAQRIAADVAVVTPDADTAKRFVNDALRIAKQPKGPKAPAFTRTINRLRQAGEDVEDVIATLNILLEKVSYGVSATPPAETEGEAGSEEEAAEPAAEADAAEPAAEADAA